MIELSIKVTILLAIPAVLALWPRILSAHCRSLITLITYSALVVLALSMVFGHELTLWQAKPLSVQGAGLVQDPAVVVEPWIEGVPGVGYPRAEFMDWLWWTFGSVALLLLLRIGARLWRCARFVKRLPACVDPTLLQILDRVQRQTRHSRDVVLKVHHHSGSPFTWGMLDPVLAVPERFSTWPVARQQHALRHELAHVQRYHCATLLFAHCVTALFWWHPLSWWVLRAYRGDIERVCDDDVIRTGANPHEYAGHLIEVARHNDLAPGFALPMAAASTLKYRISALLALKQRRSLMSNNMQRTVWLAFICFAYGLGVSQVSAAMPDDQTYLPVIKIQPAYPSDARENGVEGFVVVEFDVDEHGMPQDIQVIEQEPADGVFAASAMEAASKFYYLPSRIAGENVPTPGVRNRITFKLDEANHTPVPENLEALAEYTENSTKNKREFLNRLQPQIDQAEQAQDGHRFALLANYVLSTDPTMAEYLILRASQLGSAKPDYVKTVGGMVMFKRGALAQARQLFSQVSPEDVELHNQALAWMAYLDVEIKRQQAVRAALMDLHS